MRIVQMLQLEQNPDLIRQYRYFHSREGIWPEILQGIKDSGILEMEIYLLDHYLCMIVDLPEDLSWQEAMDRMAKAPRQAEWENFVSQFQRAAADARSDEKWQRAMDALSDSLQVHTSKAFVRVHERDANGEYRLMNLDIAKV